MIRAAILAALLAALLAACSAAGPTPNPNPEYVIGGQSNGDGSVAFLVLVHCSQQAHSWSDAKAYCDLSNLRALQVEPATYGKYAQGDPYP